MVTAHLGGRRSKPVPLTPRSFRYLGPQRRGRGHIYELLIGDYEYEMYLPNVGAPRFWNRTEGRELR